MHSIGPSQYHGHLLRTWFIVHPIHRFVTVSFYTYVIGCFWMLSIVEKLLSSKQQINQSINHTLMTFKRLTRKAYSYLSLWWLKWPLLMRLNIWYYNFTMLLLYCNNIHVLHLPMWGICRNLSFNYSYRFHNGNSLYHPHNLYILLTLRHCNMIFLKKKTQKKTVYH